MASGPKVAQAAQQGCASRLWGAEYSALRRIPPQPPKRPSCSSCPSWWSSAFCFRGRACPREGAGGNPADCRAPLGSRLRGSDGELTRSVCHNPRGGPVSSSPTRRSAPIRCRMPGCLRPLCGASAARGFRSGGYALWSRRSWRRSLAASAAPARGPTHSGWR